MIGFLSSKPTPEESVELSHALAKIDRRQRELADAGDLVPSRVLELNIARLSSSGTLSRTDSQPDSQRAWWDQANQLVQRWIVDDVPITWARIATLNSVLTSGHNAESAIRRIDLYTSGKRHAEPNMLPDLIEAFEKRVLGTVGESHPVWVASQLRYWLVSLHPFLDGNGRTSTLVADWHLLRSGYPPLCFLEIGEGTVAFTPEGKAWATPFFAFGKTARAVETSIQILLCERSTNR